MVAKAFPEMINFLLSKGITSFRSFSDGNLLLPFPLSLINQINQFIHSLRQISIRLINGPDFAIIDNLRNHFPEVSIVSVVSGVFSAKDGSSSGTFN
jgi:hypothetical protein